MTHRSKIMANKKRVDVQINDLKRAVAKDIGKHLDRAKMTQTEAAYLAHDAPSQISLIVTGKLRGFSLERLIRVRAMLGASVSLSVVGSHRPQVYTSFAA